MINLRAADVDGVINLWHLLPTINLLWTLPKCSQWKAVTSSIGTNKPFLYLRTCALILEWIICHSLQLTILILSTELNVHLFDKKVPPPRDDFILRGKRKATWANAGKTSTTSPVNKCHCQRKIFVVWVAWDLNSYPPGHHCNGNKRAFYKILKRTSPILRILYKFSQSSGW